MNLRNYKDVPPQESREKWFRSHLLGREIELRELYELPQEELDLLMAETAELRSDSGNRERNLGKYCTAGYFLEIARIIDKRRAEEIKILIFNFFMMASENSFAHWSMMGWMLLVPMASNSLNLFKSSFLNLYNKHDKKVFFVFKAILKLSQTEIFSKAN